MAPVIRYWGTACVMLSMPQQRVACGAPKIAVDLFALITVGVVMVVQAQGCVYAMLGMQGPCVMGIAPAVPSVFVQATANAKRTHRACASKAPPVGSIAGSIAVYAPKDTEVQRAVFDVLRIH